MSDRVAKIKSLIRDIPDFPTPGILFRDITPLLGSPTGFAAAIAEMVDRAPADVDVVAGVESRGFIFGAPVALALGRGFVPIRKPGKLPGSVIEETYDLEYGSSTLSMKVDALQPGQRVLLIDDLVATAGTLLAAAKLIRRAEAEVAHVEALIELTDLPGRQALENAGLTSYSAILSF